MHLATSRNFLLVVAFIALILLALWRPCDCFQPKKCHKKKYKMVITPPGIPNCRKKITFVKCEGYCHSESILASSFHRSYFQTSCFCCIPVSRRERKIIFPCGSIIEILHIKKCKCRLCWLFVLLCGRKPELHLAVIIVKMAAISERISTVHACHHHNNNIN